MTQATRTKKPDWPELLSIIDAHLEQSSEVALIEIQNDFGNDPYCILISTLLSLRTKDPITLKCSRQLFAQAASPQSMLLLSKEYIAQLIYPCAFFNNKARQILDISEILMQKYAGILPKNRDALMALPGVGLKTANLTLALGFNIPAICVDIHVHRISNRLGYVKTFSPDETEKELKVQIPIAYWNKINRPMVLFGQQFCRARAPKCTSCPLSQICAHNQEPPKDASLT